MTTRRCLFAASAAAPLLHYAGIATAQSPAGVIVMAMRIDDSTSLDPQESFEYSGNEVTANICQKLVNTPNSDPARLQGELAELIRANDARTLTITMGQPARPAFRLCRLTANVGSVVERAAAMQRQQGEDMGNAWLRQNSAGSGACRLVSWRASEGVTREANPNATTGPRTRRFLIRHIADPSAQLLGLRQGDFDIARDLGSDQIRGLQGNAAFRLVSNKRASLMDLAMNQRVAALARPQVREAVKWAIDCHAIQQNLVPCTYTVHQTFLPAGFPAAMDHTPHRRDADRAHRLAALCAARARRDADDPPLRRHRRGAAHRRLRGADRAAARGTLVHPLARHARHARHVLDHPHGRGPRLPRPRRAAADPRMGHDDRDGTGLHPRPMVGAGDPGPRDLRG
jgi:ABC-type transport system substrate-binding protein